MYLQKTNLSCQHVTKASTFITVHYRNGIHAVDAKSALNAKHTASRTKLASHAQKSERRASQFFLKINKRQKQLDTKAWNLPGGTRQFHICG
jgi:hypothetical protein